MNTKQVIAFGCWILLAFQGCSKESVDNREVEDVGFAKTAFFSMVNGSAAETIIDWETFQAFGEDLGAKYRAISSDAEKAAARKSFLAGFSAGTPNIKANPGGITHWRAQSENPSETIVAADMQLGAVLSITVSKRDGNRKIAALDIKK